MRIVISGTVGVGKSTTSENVYKHLLAQGKDASFILELPEENVYLDKYYENRPEWAFLIQMDFLLGRYRTLIAENEQQEINKDRIAVFDRHYLDDMIFANLKSIREDMSGFQYSMYKNTNLELAKNIQPEDQPDYFILLKVPFEQILERIKLRGREAEQAVDEEYWRDLYFQYYENPEIKAYLQENTKRFIELDISGLSQDQVVQKVLEIIS